MIWGGREGAVGCRVWSGWLYPQSPFPTTTSPQYSTSLLTAVLCPDLASSPSSSWRCPANPSLPFISCPLSPPRREEKSRTGAAGIALLPLPPALGDGNKAGTVPHCHEASVLMLQPSPSCAGAKQCLVLAGLAQRVPGSDMGENQTRLLKTTLQAQEDWEHCQGHCLHQRTAGCGMTLSHATHAQGFRGAANTASAILQPK